MPARVPPRTPANVFRPTWRTLWRMALLAALLLGLNLGVSAVLQRVVDPLASTSFMWNVTVVVLMLAYVLLLAIPFMPGVEIGISLLMAHGAMAAPFVYLGTLAGLMLAFGVGVLLSGPVSCRFLMVLGLTRACAFVDETKRLSPPERLQRMQDVMPGRVGHWLLRHRFLLLAALLNLPGNSLIGGGGGIAFLAGMSRTFTVWQFALTIALATAPVPLAVWFFGAGLLQ